MIELKHGKDVMLSKQELIIAKKIIANTHTGEYKLKKLYGDIWITIKSPTTFGKRFKESVLLGQLKNIETVEQDGDNAWMYRVN